MDRLGFWTVEAPITQALRLWFSANRSVNRPRTTVIWPFPDRTFA